MKYATCSKCKVLLPELNIKMDKTLKGSRGKIMSPTLSLHFYSQLMDSLDAWVTSLHRKTNSRLRSHRSSVELVVTVQTVHTIFDPAVFASQNFQPGHMTMTPFK